MTTDAENPWWYTNLSDYYDVNSAAVTRNADLLAQLDEAGSRSAIENIRQCVLTHLQVLDDELLTKVAVSITDDLYTFGCSVSIWDDPVRMYIGAVWSTFFAYLTERGIALRYVIDNTWPDGLQRPLELFPDLFALAGVTYVCPHEIALALPEAQSVEHTVDGLMGLVMEARHVANMLVHELAEGRRHFVYLEADYVDGALDGVRGLPLTPGTVEMFRTEPGLPGTTVHVRIEPLPH